MFVTIPRMTIAAIATMKVIAAVAAFWIAMFSSSDDDWFGCVYKFHRFCE
jgi:hypothetical protein